MSSSELTVCLMDLSAVVLEFSEQIKPLTSCEVLNKVYHKLKEDIVDGSQRVDYKSLFSIWVTSPYLELQLQPTHRPFNVLTNWDSLLTKHGPIEVVEDPNLIAKDEPTLSFQRNVFCGLDLEKGIRPEDVGLLRLLYFEAKLNVLDGRYPCDRKTYEKLAAIQAIIELGTYDETRHSVNHFREHLKDYIPCNYFKENKTNALFRTFSREFSHKLIFAQKIFDKFKDTSSGIKDNVLGSDYRLFKSYLEICWEIPCYGSAFFSAQIERPIKSGFASLMNHFDQKVWIAINSTGLHVISQEKPELLVSIDYNDLCWAVGCPESSDPNCMACLFIQIPDDKKKTNVLQIFSRQYQLIETIINSFIDDLKKKSIPEEVNDSNPRSCESHDCTDGATTTDSITSSANHFSFGPKPRMIRKKLSLAKFDESGNCVNKRGSWVQNKRSMSVSKE